MTEWLSGYKEISVATGKGESTIRKEAATYPDPLPVRKLGRKHVWALHDRIRLHEQRHASDVHPIPGIPIIEGWVRIAKMVHLSASRARHLAPWSAAAPPDPLPVFRLSSGTIAAYRDAVVDWLDRRSGTASAPRYRRRWQGALLSDRKADSALTVLRHGAHSAGKSRNSRPRRDDT